MGFFTIISLESLIRCYSKLLTGGSISVPPFWTGTVFCSVLVRYPVHLSSACGLQGIQVLLDSRPEILGCYAKCLSLRRCFGLLLKMQFSKLVRLPPSCRCARHQLWHSLRRRQDFQQKVILCSGYCILVCSCMLCLHG